MAAHHFGQFRYDFRVVRRCFVRLNLLRSPRVLARRHRLVSGHHFGLRQLRPAAQPLRDFASNSLRPSFRIHLDAQFAGADVRVFRGNFIGGEFHGRATKYAVKPDTIQTNPDGLIRSPTVQNCPKRKVLSREGEPSSSPSRRSLKSPDS